MEGSYRCRRRIAAPLLLALVTLFGVAAAEARQSPVVVTINDPAGTRTVTAAQLKYWVEIARANDYGASSKRGLQSVALQLLTSFRWIDGEARSQGVAVSDAEVEQSFQEQVQSRSRRRPTSGSSCAARARHARTSGTASGSTCCRAGSATASSLPRRPR
jgi:hypothetical protein